MIVGKLLDEYGIVIVITITMKPQQNMFHYGIQPSKNGLTNDIRQTEKQYGEGLYNLVLGVYGEHKQQQQQEEHWDSDEQRWDKHGMILE